MLPRSIKGTLSPPRALIACFSGHAIALHLTLAASGAHAYAQIQEPFVRVPGATQVIEERC
jgi:hypothetical protein